LDHIDFRVHVGTKNWAKSQNLFTFSGSPLLLVTLEITPWIRTPKIQMRHHETADMRKVVEMRVDNFGDLLEYQGRSWTGQKYVTRF